MRFPANAADGSLNAPVKAAGPQHPTWLNDMPHPPPWNVAGIDYPVGIPDGTILRDPRTPNILPSPCTIDTTTTPATLTTGGDNVHLDAFDFTDVLIVDEGGSGPSPSSRGTVITNSRFRWTQIAPSPMISCSNITMRYCEVDCLNADVTGLPGNLISCEGYGVSSPITIEFCWIKNCRNVMFSLTDGSTQKFGFNLLENIGLFDPDGAQHPDFFNWNGGQITPCSAHLYYNTMVQNNAAEGSTTCTPTGTTDNGLGFVLGGDGTSIMGTCLFEHNTLRQSPDVPAQCAGANSDGSSMQLNEWTSGPQQGTTLAPGGSVRVLNNYCAPSPGGVFASSKANATFSGNINMKTGASLDVSG